MSSRKEKFVKVITARPNEEFSIEVIENKLESFQKFVGGLIEVIDLGDGIYCIINEEGKLIDLKPNFLYEIMEGYYDLVVGNIILIADYMDKDGKEFRSLTEDELYIAYEKLAYGRYVLHALQERERKVKQ